MEKLTMNINDFKDAFTYASEDEPDIAWLQNRFNVKITTNDSVATIEGEEDAIITMYHQYHLEDYVSVGLTEKVEGSFGRYFFDKRDVGKQELLNDCDDLGLDCMEHYDSYEVTGSRVKIAKLLSLYNMQSAWKDIETLHKVEESTEQLNESETREQAIARLLKKFPNAIVLEHDEKTGKPLLPKELWDDWCEDDDLQESIEKHNKLNPDLFENNELKEDVKESVKNIVNTFEEIIKKDGVKFKIKDIVLVGSNVSYNYTDDSDLDIHIIADSSVVKDNSEQSKKYLGILYNLYKSMFNSDYDITIHGVPAEVYVELDDIGAAKSNGIYSLNSGWIKEPVQEDIPDIDMEAFRKEFEEWERKYKELIKNIKEDNGISLEESVTKLFEMVFSKTDAMDRCISLGKKFIEHFDKLYKDPKNISANHWMGEMQGWFDTIKKIVLKHSNKQLSNTQLVDWFFTAGSTFEVMLEIKEPTKEDKKESDCYNNFIKRVLKTENIRESFENIFNESLQESSITRIGRQLEYGNVAIISAYRYNYSEKENRIRQDKLKSIIRNELKLGYKEFKAKFVGSIEDTGELITSVEYSLFVPNMTRKQAIKLGSQFEQQSVIVKDEDGIQEIATTEFIDENGKSFKVGEVIRTFESTGRNFLNLNDAIEIYSNRVGGSVSKPLNIDKPFTLKQKKLESVYEVLDPKPSMYQTSRSYVKVYESKDLKEAGYHGYSMSNNAVAAYEKGEKPKSKNGTKVRYN